MFAGTESSTSVPAPARLRIFSLAAYTYRSPNGWFASELVKFDSYSAAPGSMPRLDFALSPAPWARWLTFPQSKHAAMNWIRARTCIRSEPSCMRWPRAVWRSLAKLRPSLLVALAPSDVPRLADSGVDRWVRAFTFGISMITSLLVGLVPVLYAGRVDLNDALKLGGTRSVTRGGIVRMRGVFVVAEIVLAVVLVENGDGNRSHARRKFVEAATNTSLASVAADAVGAGAGRTAT